GHALIGRALYLPEGCAGDEEHRELAGVPEEVLFATKPQLAGDLLDHAHGLAARASDGHASPISRHLRCGTAGAYRPPRQQRRTINGQPASSQDPGCHHFLAQTASVLATGDVTCDAPGDGPLGGVEIVTFASSGNEQKWILQHGTRPDAACKGSCGRQTTSVLTSSPHHQGPRRPDGDRLGAGEIRARSCRGRWIRWRRTGCPGRRPAGRRPWSWLSRPGGS